MSENSDGESDKKREQEFVALCAQHPDQVEDLEPLFSKVEIKKRRMKVYQAMSSLHPGQGNPLNKLLSKIELGLGELRGAWDGKQQYDSEAQRAFQAFLKKIADAEPSSDTSIAQEFEGLHDQNEQFMRQQLSSDSESQSSLDLEESAGKEDPVELDSGPTWRTRVSPTWLVAAQAAASAERKRR